MPSNICYAFRGSITVVGLLMWVAPLLAAGGTSIVASKGQPVGDQTDWPAGVQELLNDPCRTTGWNSWFTEWPNDVNQYGFEIRSTADLNRLIGLLAEVDAEVKQVRLSYLTEPRGLGWVTQLPEGNKLAAVFSLGSQTQIDQWYATVRKPFGVLEFLDVPVAVPPTLTLFVGHDAVNLDELQIPQEISVVSGYIPLVFHRSNTKLEQRQEEEAAKTTKPAKEQPPANLDAPARAAFDKIEAFLKARADSQSTNPGR